MLKRLKPYIDLKLILIIVMIQLILNLYDIFQRSFITKKGVLKLNYDVQGAEIYGKLAEFIGVVIYMIIVSIIVSYFLKKKTSVWIVSLFHLTTPFTLPQFTWIIYFIPEMIMEQNFSSLEFTDFYISRYILNIKYYYILYFLLLGVIYLYYYLKKNQENKIQTAHLQAQLSEAKLRFLQSQLQPHFLFNSLNSIHSLMDIDINKSKDMMVNLSDVLRAVLENKDKDLIELQDELFILKKYISINKIRFSNHLDFHFKIEKQLENALVPNMLFQPIVENAIKHGYDKNHLKLKIFIYISKKNNMLNINVRNDGVEMKQSLIALLKKGNGLLNIKDRLKTLYNDNYSFKIFNENRHFVVDINIPLQMHVVTLNKS